MKMLKNGGNFGIEDSRLRRMTDSIDSVLAQDHKALGGFNAQLDTLAQCSSALGIH